MDTAEDDDDQLGIVEDPYVVQLREEGRQYNEYRAGRRRHLETLMGGDNSLAWEAPAPLADCDAQLAEHAAQLRNATRFLMSELFEHGDDFKRTIQAAGVVARLIGTNAAVIRALKAGSAAKSKTVRGVPVANDPHDMEQQG